MSHIDHSSKGEKNCFTLIELLVVIAIIGILASAVVVSLGGATDSAADARKRRELHNLGSLFRILDSSFASRSDHCASDSVERLEDEYGKISDGLSCINQDPFISTSTFACFQNPSPKVDWSVKFILSDGSVIGKDSNESQSTKKLAHGINAYLVESDDPTERGFHLRPLKQHQAPNYSKIADAVSSNYTKSQVLTFDYENLNTSASYGIGFQVNGLSLGWGLAEVVIISHENANSTEFVESEIDNPGTSNLYNGKVTYPTFISGSPIDIGILCNSGSNPTSLSLTFRPHSLWDSLVGKYFQIYIIPG